MIMYIALENGASMDHLFDEEAEGPVYGNGMSIPYHVETLDAMARALGLRPLEDFMVRASRFPADCSAWDCLTISSICSGNMPVPVRWPICGPLKLRWPSPNRGIRTSASCSPVDYVLLRG